MFLGIFQEAIFSRCMLFLFKNSTYDPIRACSLYITKQEALKVSVCKIELIKNKLSDGFYSSLQHFLDRFPALIYIYYNIPM